MKDHHELMREAEPRPGALDNGGAVGTAAKPRARRYLRVSAKLWLMTAFAVGWVGLCTYLALPWSKVIAEDFGTIPAWIIIFGVALIPGYVNAFLIAGLLFDWRPEFKIIENMPGLSVLIAAYNEESCIAETLDSIARQDYRGHLEVIVIDDGSSDGTAAIVEEYLQRPEYQSTRLSLKLIRQPQNGGKARALNTGLERVSHELVATVDADSYLFKNALNNLVSNHLLSPSNTAATAGTVLVRNSRKNLITRLQEWDYFLGISVVKRVQSLLQGTLVAQGAFSVYDLPALKAINGWPESVGEDIVLTWAILNQGHRVGFAENAFAFTRVPETYGAFYRQRKRWSRGLIEAFRHYPKTLVRLRLNTPFVWLNLLFPYLDLVYLFVFLPGVIAAIFFQYYAIAGLMTLLVLPLALIMYTLMYYKQLAVFRRYELKVRRNVLGALLFALGYQLLMSPASLMGYFSEILNLRKTW